MSAVAKIAHVWDRADDEWYVEPESATAGLLTVESFDGLTLDPACGGGNIVRTLRESGAKAFGTDIVNRLGLARPLWFITTRNFLSDYSGDQWINVVTNPPFFRAKGTEAFIRHALTVAQRKVAVFTDVKFLAGSGRANGLFKDHPPSRVWIITPRPSCPPGAYLEAGNKAGSGTADWCWLVWDKAIEGATTQLGWIRA